MGSIGLGKIVVNFEENEKQNYELLAEVQSAAKLYLESSIEPLLLQVQRELEEVGRTVELTRQHNGFSMIISRGDEVELSYALSIENQPHNFNVYTTDNLLGNRGKMELISVDSIRKDFVQRYEHALKKRLDAIWNTNRQKLIDFQK